MKKVREVLRLYGSMSLSIRQIHGAAGVARSTVQDYVKRFEASGLSSAQIDGFDDDQLKAALFPERCRDVKASKPLPDMAYIHQELQQRKKTKVTMMLLREEYMEAHPDGYAYTQFRVHYNRYRQKLNPSMRQTHIGGEKLFVDYSGLTVPIYDAKSGETSPAQVFVAVLGASGYTFVHVP
jgi:transposase